MDIIRRRCNECGSEIQYNEQHDAHYCELCNKWLEEACGDEECEYCWGRPRKPSQCISDVGSSTLDR